MQYIITFLEGIVTFISPCLLPMLPVYLGYFAGGGERGSKKTLRCALGFVLGFTAVFMALGALAGTLGALITRMGRWVDIICGGVVVLFGLGYMGLFQLPSFGKAGGLFHGGDMTFGSSLLLGMVFSVGWTPCVGAFLGSALLLASQQGHTVVGLLLLLCYSLGLGVPFLISALLIDQLKGAFDFIKRNYRAVNIVSGLMLVILGVAMMTGWLTRLLFILA